MQKFNYHTHTYRCGHAFGDDDQYVRAAIKAGYTKLGFSDHVPYKGFHNLNDRMDFDQLSEYIQSMKDLREKYKNSINIRIGLEIEYFEDKEPYYEYLRQITDYIILGQHSKYEDSMDYFYYCDDEDVLTYATSIKKALDGKFADMLAHPDYFMLGRREWSEACSEASRIICNASILNDIPIEINLNGIRHGKFCIDGEMQYAYPFRKFWEIVSDYGCKVVFGVDAHLPLTLLDKTRYSTALEILEGLSLNFDHPQF